MSKIIIVESSAKIKTITRFLRGAYKVIASGGHIADLPKHILGINIDDDFSFDIRADQNKLNKLKKQLEECEEVALHHEKREVKRAKVTKKRLKNSIPDDHTCDNVGSAIAKNGLIPAFSSPLTHKQFLS